MACCAILHDATALARVEWCAVLLALLCCPAWSAAGAAACRAAAAAAHCPSAAWCEGHWQGLRYGLLELCAGQKRVFQQARGICTLPCHPTSTPNGRQVGEDGEQRQMSGHHLPLTCVVSIRPLGPSSTIKVAAVRCAWHQPLTIRTQATTQLSVCCSPSNRQCT